MNDLKEQVEFIAKQCECLVEDYRWYEDLDEKEREAYDKACEECKGEIGVGAYLQDMYDTMYYMHGKDKLDGVKVCVAYGGPNIYINTYTGKVQGAWWGSTHEVEISDYACTVIDDFYRDVIACTW